MQGYTNDRLLIFFCQQTNTLTDFLVPFILKSVNAKLFSAVVIFSLFLSFSSFISPKIIYAVWYVNGNGNLVFEPESPTGEVLGTVYAKDGEDGGGSSGSGSSGDGGGGSSSSSGGSGGGSEEKKEESKSSSSGSSGTSTTNSNPVFFTPQSSSGKKEKDKSSKELQSTSSTKSIISPAKAPGLEFKEEEAEQGTGEPRIKTEEGKTEIIFGEGEKIKTRTRDGETRTDIYSGGVKVRFEQKNGRMIIKAENEANEEVLLGEQELFKIEERLDKNTVKVATGSGNSFVFARGNMAAKTNFPLSVDLATNALAVTTPAGIKTVTILPDQAVNNMLAANVIDKLGTAAVTEAARTGTLTGVSGIVDLALRNHVPVYEINGLSDQKLLGFIPVAIPQKVVVSAETGELVAAEKTPLNTLLDLLSI